MRDFSVSRLRLRMLVQGVARLRSGFRSRSRSPPDPSIRCPRSSRLCPASFRRLRLLQPQLTTRTWSASKQRICKRTFCDLLQAQLPPKRWDNAKL
jgi:hypothetical protein